MCWRSSSAARPDIATGAPTDGSSLIGVALVCLGALRQACFGLLLAHRIVRMIGDRVGRHESHLSDEFLRRFASASASLTAMLA